MNFWVDPLASSASISGRCLSSLLLPGPFGRPTGRPEARLARRASFVRAAINLARSRRQSFPQKADQNHPRKLGGAKSMIYTPFQLGIENPTADSVPLSR